MLQQSEKEPRPWGMEQNLTIPREHVFGGTGLWSLQCVLPRAAGRRLQSTEAAQGWGPGELGSGPRCRTLSEHQLSGL